MTTTWRHAVVFLPIQDVGSHRFLLLARRRRGKYADCLTPPGGELEAFDTSLYATAVRESEEELGITPSFPTFYAGGIAIPHYGLALHAFIGRYTGQPQESEELDQPRPYSVNRLPKGMRPDAYLWVNSTLERFDTMRYREPRFLRILHSDRGTLRRLDHEWPSDLRLPRQPWWPPPQS
jgi:8-oxo-dGTP pyrophosphatase MutT (NUDIX family)